MKPTDAAKEFTVWWESGGFAYAAGPCGFDEAKTMARQIGPDVHIWEERKVGDNFEWNDWQMWDGDWAPLLGGFHPFPPSRPWEA